MAIEVRGLETINGDGVGTAIDVDLEILTVTRNDTKGAIVGALQGSTNGIVADEHM